MSMLRYILNTSIMQKRNDYQIWQELRRIYHECKRDYHAMENAIGKHMHLGVD